MNPLILNDCHRLIRAVAEELSTQRDRADNRSVLARREAGETLVDIARSYNVHHSMISRLNRTRLD